MTDAFTKVEARAHIMPGALLLIELAELSQLIGFDHHYAGAPRPALLSTPYTRRASHKRIAGIGDTGLDAAFQDAQFWQMCLLEAGVPVFSPIVQFHSMILNSGLDPLDWSRWMAAGKPFRNACDGIIIPQIEGWRDSEGIAAECIEALDRGQTVIQIVEDIAVETVPAGG